MVLGRRLLKHVDMLLSSREGDLDSTPLLIHTEMADLSAETDRMSDDLGFMIVPVRCA